MLPLEELTSITSNSTFASSILPCWSWHWDSWVMSRVWLWQTALSSTGTDWGFLILNPLLHLCQPFLGLSSASPTQSGVCRTTGSHWIHTAQANDLPKALDAKCLLLVPEELQFGVIQVKLHSLAQEQHGVHPHEAVKNSK